VLVSSGVHPHYRETIDTYLQGIGTGKAAITTLPSGKNGRPQTRQARRSGEGRRRAVVVGYPNFYGCVTDVRSSGRDRAPARRLLITVTEEPFALALLEPRASSARTFAVGEGSRSAFPLQFGGPYVGLFACREGRDFLQQIPGRLVGETVDKNGERGYVLTLATRAQHIRRERATSNICTNTGLCALSVTIRMCMLGKQGFVEAGRQCLAKSEYLRSKISGLAGYSLVYPSTPTFHEFAVRVRGGSAAASSTRSSPRAFSPASTSGRVEPARADQLLIAVTERASRADLDAFVSALDGI